MTLDNMTGITEGSYTGFCKSQLITCNRVKECNDNCPFEDALKHADKEMDEQNVIDHDRDWIIGCLQHDGFIHTHRFDKANQIILDALSAEAVPHGRLIDADRLKSYIDCGHLRPPTEVCFSELDVCNMIDKAPTASAEAVEVVRCKDCKNWYEWEHGTDSCHRSENGYNWFGVDATDYCSFGERKEATT